MEAFTTPTTHESRLKRRCLMNEAEKEEEEREKESNFEFKGEKLQSKKVGAAQSKGTKQNEGSWSRRLETHRPQWRSCSCPFHSLTRIRSERSN